MSECLDLVQEVLAALERDSFTPQAAVEEPKPDTIPRDPLGRFKKVKKANK